MFFGSAAPSVNRNLLFWSTSARSGESMTVAARKKYRKAMLGMIMDHRDLATASVIFDRGAMMIGAHKTEIATLQN